MCFGNRIGFEFNKEYDNSTFFAPEYGSVIAELSESAPVEKILKEDNVSLLGKTMESAEIKAGNFELNIDHLAEVIEERLSAIFPVGFNSDNRDCSIKYFEKRGRTESKNKLGIPRVMIPVFPGTNCEYDLGKAFQNEGASVSTPVFINLTSADIEASIENFKREIERSQILAIPGGFSAGDEPDGSGKFIATVFRNPYLSDALMEFVGKRDGLIIGICNGFQALVKLGLLPYGEIRPLNEKSPTLTFNRIGRHISRVVNTKIVSVLSPWYSLSRPGDIHTIPISHGEGRFVADGELLTELKKQGQISTQYVNLSGIPINDSQTNPNGSDYCIEGITSPDGRILGKMGHSERVGKNLYKNVPGNYDLSIFRAGVRYFK